MAEERLIDDDKDKKYRIRKNADGEDELFIDETVGSVEESDDEGMFFDAPELTEDDETAVMTPEQLAAKREQQEKERQEREKKAAYLIEQCEKDCEEGNFATALEYLRDAEEIGGENEALYALKLKIYTQNFTDDTQIAAAAEAAENLGAYDKSKLLNAAEDWLKRGIDVYSERVEKLSEENERNKLEREQFFNIDKKKQIIIFSCVLVPFIVFIALAAYFSTIMFSDKNGQFIVLTIVFAALAFVMLIVVAFSARALNTAFRRLRLNRRDASTKLGRDVIESKNKLAAYRAVYSALKD